MYKCKKCGSLTKEPKRIENSYGFECDNCGNKGIFYTDIFESTEDKNTDKADSDFEYWWRGYYKK